MRKNRAFTLAETLVVIGIIGVVAALTLPNLNHSTSDKETIAKVQKLYSNLSDALNRAKAAHGPLNSWFGDDDQGQSTSYDVERNKRRAKRVGERLTENFKVVKVCENADNLSECFTQQDVDALGHKHDSTLWDCTTGGVYGMVLADGTSMAFKYYYMGEDYHQFLMCVDIDGPHKGQNAWGRDHFIYWLNNDEGVLPGGHDFYRSPEEEGHNTQPCGKALDTCTAWVVQKGNMDYTKTSDGKTCPNGTVLSWDGPSTCN